MTWIAVIEATYESAEDAAYVMEVLARNEGITATVEGAKITIRDDYGSRSKLGAVRPLVEAMESAFDPVARDDYYRPWPDSVTARCEFVVS